MEQARMLLKPVLANHPEHPALLLRAAWIDYLDDRHDAALVAVRHVLVKNPSNENARGLYFELLMEGQQHREAETVIIELLREFPEESSYYGRYADLMLRTLNVGKAARLAREGLTYEPDCGQCLAAQAICELIEQPGRPSQGLQQLLLVHPRFLSTLSLVIVALEQRGHLQEAKKFSQELVRIQPDNEHVAAIASELRVKAHWSMLPLRPLQKWGWGAAAVLWLLFVAVSSVLRQASPIAAGVFAIVMSIYIVYSWVWPSLLRRLFR